MIIVLDFKCNEFPHNGKAREREKSHLSLEIDNDKRKKKYNILPKVYLKRRLHSGVDGGIRITDPRSIRLLTMFLLNAKIMH